MNVDENLRIVDEFVDAFNKRDWDRISAVHDESVVYWTPDNPEPLKGRDKVRQVFVGYTGAFPDARNKKERAFGVGDWVFMEMLFTGTHKGALTGPDGKQVPGTGRRVRIPMGLPLQASWRASHRVACLLGRARYVEAAWTIGLKASG